VLPHTRRRWAFRVWAFGGGLAAALCSRMPFFYFFIFFVVVRPAFFIFLSDKMTFLVFLGLYPPSVFLPIFATFYRILPEISPNIC
jgi:hypothetical protein